MSAQDAAGDDMKHEGHDDKDYWDQEHVGIICDIIGVKRRNYTHELLHITILCIEVKRSGVAPERPEVFRIVQRIEHTVIKV